MAGLIPAIHVFLADRSKDVDARDKPGHDELLDVDCFRLRLVRYGVQVVANAPLRKRFAFVAGNDGSGHTMYWPPLIVMVEPVMPPASSAARNTTARAISSGSPRRLTGISGRMLFSSTSFGTACTISVLM